MRACNFCVRLMDKVQEEPKSSTNSPIAISRKKSLSLPDSPDSNRSLDGFRRMLTSSFFNEQPLKETFFKSEEVPVEDDDSPLMNDGWLPSPFLEPKFFPSERPSKPRKLTQRRFSLKGRPHHLHQVSNSNVDESEHLDPLPELEVLKTSSPLNPTSLDHLKRLLLQLLESLEPSHVKEWSDVIMDLVIRFCSTVNPDVKNGDAMDPRNYVKIKRIPGGRIQDSLFVDGIMATKKPVHKRMLKSINRPRILLLTFALEYQRVENQFMSLDPVLTQEREHLQNLVGRIVALKPDVVLVQKTVAGLAQEFLTKEGITVVQSLKPDVMEFIARCTHADILHSVDKLALNPQLGICQQLSFKVFVDPLIQGFRKTFLQIRGCPPELGCTLVLRGDTFENLTTIKRIVHLMVLMAYNIRLEACLIRDQHCQMSVPEKSHIVSGLPLLSQINITSFSVEMAIKAFENTILTGSPSVKFPLPYLLANLRIQERRLQKGRVLSNANLELPPKLLEMSSPLISSALSERLKNEDVIEEFAPPTGLGESAMGESRQSTQVDLSYVVSQLTSLSPFTHQNILVLYSVYCKGDTIPCIWPQLDLLEYYGDSDLTCGQFVEEYCLSAKYTCPRKGCDRQMLAHSRHYAHGHGSISIHMEEQACPLPGMEDNIIMWSHCGICNASTPFIPMSDDTWKYSFGKYLELTFNHRKLNVGAISCTHDIHRDHTRYFSFHKLTIRISYKPIDLFEVSVPYIRFQARLDVASRIRQSNLEIIRSLVSRFYDSCLERVKAFTYDIVPVPRLAACKDILQDMCKRLLSEKKFILQRLQQTFITSSPTDYLALNQVYKQLQEQVTAWDAEFAAFVRNQIQADSTDIRRVTASIRRIFVDPAIEAAKHQSVLGIPSEGHFDLDHEDVVLEIEAPKLGSSPLTHMAPLSEMGLSVRQSRSIVLSTSHRKFSTLYLRENIGSVYIMDMDITVPDLLPSPSITPMMFPDLDIFMDRSQSPELEDPVFSTMFQSSSYPKAVKPSSSYRNWIMDDFDDFEGGSFVEDEGVMFPKRFFLDTSDSIRPHSEPGKETRFRTPSFEKSDPLNRRGEQVRVEEENVGKSELNTITGVAGETEEETVNSQLFIPGERTSIMKTITNLWTGNPANFLPLDYPMTSSEHHFSDSLVIVREEEPTSLIALTLDSKQYKEKLEYLKSRPLSNQPLPKTVRVPGQDSFARFSVELDDPNVEPEELTLKTIENHIRYQFWDDTTKMNVKVYFAQQFDQLRKNCGADDMFVQSLARCVKWEASGGRSGSAFMKSKDDWLVIKQLSRPEMDAMYKFAPDYFEYMSQAFFHALPTMLGKIFGFFRISYKNSSTGKNVKYDLLIMENLFFERKIANIFDLKGSTRNRHVQSTGKQNEVLMDENLVEFIYDKPLYIREHSKKLLRASVWNDTLFLSRLNVMDYSIVVGIDSESNELVCGIVDYVRTYTLDKKLETWVKETGLLGGGKEPTIVTPRQYKNRFREAMERYFLQVPDRFSSSKPV